MRENQIAISLRSALLPRLQARNINAEVKQGNQPSSQGVPSGPTVFFFIVANKRYGFPERSTEWDETDEVMRATVSEVIETTLQFNAIAPQFPANDFALTPGDILKAAASILQSDSALADLRRDGLGVLRVQDIRTGYTKDDKGEFMANPSFDIVVTHRDTTSEIIGIVNAREVNIHRV